jgi:hypothetical protein
MSKMGSHDPFECFQHKLWSKERLRVSVNSTSNHKKFYRYYFEIHACRWYVTYCWKAFDKG